MHESCGISHKQLKNNYNKIPMVLSIPIDPKILLAPLKRKTGGKKDFRGVFNVLEGQS